MRLNSMVLCLLAATAFGQEPTGGNTDMNDLVDDINDLIDLFPPVPSDFQLPTEIPSVPVFDNVGPPPSTLLNVLITAIPASVFPELFFQDGRNSLISEFQAGNTPDWYEALPTDIKSYLSALAAEMTSAGVTLPTSGGLGFSFPTDGFGGGNGDDDDGEGTSTSSGLGSRPTGAVAGSLAVAAGILGVAIAL
ncbi:hypothetical protein VTO42DRAFT_1709 [Malbranchea cinnamomea]